MQKRAIETKKKILLTAQKLFAKFGPNGITVDKIAEKAQVNKQRIYAYYQSKNKLFESVLVDAFNKINQKDEHLLSLTESDIANLTRILLEHYFSIHLKNPIFWRLIAHANLESTVTLDTLQNIKAESFTHLKKLYMKGQQQAVFSPSVSFETYIFHLIAVSYIYFSNQKTLAKTLNAPLFDSETGLEKVITETVSLLDFKAP